MPRTVHLYLLNGKERRRAGCTCLIEEPESKFEGDLIPLNERQIVGVFKIANREDSDVGEDPSLSFTLRPRPHLVALKLVQTGAEQPLQSKLTVWPRNRLPTAGQKLVLDETGVLMNVQQTFAILPGLESAEYLVYYIPA